MSEVGEKVCMNHTDKPAVGKCISCFKPLCGACIIRHEGHNYCSDACIEGAAEVGDRMDDMRAADKRLKRKRTIKKIIIFLILCGVAYAAYHIISKDPKLSDQIKSKLEEAQKSIE